MTAWLDGDNLAGRTDLDCQHRRDHALMSPDVEGPSRGPVSVALTLGNLGERCPVVVIPAWGKWVCQEHLQASPAVGMFDHPRGEVPYQLPDPPSAEESGPTRGQ